MPEVQFSCDTNGWIVTLTRGFKFIEAEGSTVSEALYKLSEQVELDEAFWSYMEELTGVEI